MKYYMLLTSIDMTLLCYIERKENKNLVGKGSHGRRGLSAACKVRATEILVSDERGEV
ncbi:hypothetical protein OEZ53_17590 [Mesorhizobium sp. YC-2]|uniref:hypothetical protein n=1 Tax=Mesorhizobium sp. YC-2 TaxID=2986064 RepID=UPI0021E6EB9C|nr:hypothetical protein [Mesorhizobium sp. YC-2]MCV3208458.1 hypothetical protein [Mesorhizobium sp. YC-2]